MDIRSVKNYLMFTYTISRPRFWMYLAGPYLIGCILAISSSYELYNLTFLSHLIYFTFFANFFLYGVNDYFDREIDKINPKKQDKEKVFDQKYYFNLIVNLVFCVLITFLLILINFTISYLLLFVIFFGLSFYYSAPPIRFKVIPVFDILSNCLYVLPGLIGYYLFSNNNFRIDIIIAAVAWVCGMQLFSSIVDIQSDKKSNILTTAVILGTKKSLLLNTVLWLIPFSIIWLNYSFFIALIFFIYPLITLFLVFYKKYSISKIYWWFPYINTIIGFILFWAIVYINKISF